jgi:hypothetical protein
VGVKTGRAGGQRVRVDVQRLGTGLVVQVADPPLAGQAGELGWEHQRWCGRTKPEVPGAIVKVAKYSTNLFEGIE